MPKEEQGDKRREYRAHDELTSPPMFQNFMRKAGITAIEAISRNNNAYKRFYRKRRAETARYNCAVKRNGVYSDAGDEYAAGNDRYKYSVKIQQKVPARHLNALDELETRFATDGACDSFSTTSSP